MIDEATTADRAEPPPPRDDNAPEPPSPLVHRDDGSHTPPHGDAVLPRHHPAA